MTKILEEIKKMTKILQDTDILYLER